jgi:hypothetical protein
MAELPLGMLAAFRNELNITWADDAGDTKLTGIIFRGMKRIDGYAGETCDYTVEDKPRELLLSYCMYALAGEIDEWEKNYTSLILDLQNAKEVARYIAEQNASSE